MMKLSIEEKAKAYDEAKARMSKAFNSNRCTIGFMNEIFPELRENWDERIRTKLIEFFSGYNTDEEWWGSITEKDILAWLEKQGEQKPAEWSEDDREYMESLLDIINGTPSLAPSEVECHKDWLKSLKDRVQPQPNAEWSEEDEENFARVDYACLKTYGGDSYSSDWLRKFLGIHKKWKPSDKQMNALEHYMNTLVCNEHKEILFGLYTDLKKLKG